MEILYGDIGRRIKYLAFAVCMIGCVSSVLSGCFIIFTSYEYVDVDPLTGLFIVVFGPIASFISTWVLYGFGQLIENTNVLIDCNISSGKSLMQISRCVSQDQKSKLANARHSVGCDDRAFIAFVENAKPEDLHNLAASFDNPNCALSNWQKEYVLSHLVNTKM